MYTGVTEWQVKHIHLVCQTYSLLIAKVILADDVVDTIRIAVIHTKTK